METVLLVLSGVLFIYVFGLHIMISNSDLFDQPMYLRNPTLSSIPWISGFLLPTIPFSLVTELNWFLVLILNAGLVYFIGPRLVRGIYVRFASGKGKGNDMLISFIIALIALIIGLIIH